ncbi:MAG TPA: hypothetical protein VGM88_21425 [Kofleriaceae bacterium]|jgi:hypothetical protein
MSRLQSRAKTYLIPLIRGEWRQIDEYARKAIAAWAAMTTMIIECRDPATRATIAAEREFLAKHLSLPMNWYVWVGVCTAPRWAHGFNHFGFGGRRELEIQDDGTSRVVAQSECQEQSTAFVLERLFVLTFSSRVGARRIDPQAFAKVHGLRWVDAAEEWIRPETTLDDEHADAISSTFVPDAMRSFVRHAWET